MESTKVCMVVKNQLWNDAKVKKEAISLSGAGFSVTIIAGTEEGCSTEETQWPIANNSAQLSLLD